MRDQLVLLAGALLLGFHPVVARQNQPVTKTETTRDDRVVLYSPHFDVPVPRWGGLNCPSGPLHLYGFETEAEVGAPSLHVRVFLYDPTKTRDYVLPADGSAAAALVPVRALVRLTHDIRSGLQEELPVESPWAQQADEAGLVSLDVPPGVYRIQFDYLGVGKEEGIIRVRAERSDSLHAYLIPGAVCNE